MGWILKSKAAKLTSGALAGGGSLLALVFGLHADLKSEVKAAEFRSKSYAVTQISHVSVVLEVKLSNIERGQEEIKTLLLRQDDRIYNHKHK